MADSTTGYLLYECPGCHCTWKAPTLDYINSEALSMCPELECDETETSSYDSEYAELPVDESGELYDNNIILTVVERPVVPTVSILTRGLVQTNDGPREIRPGEGYVMDGVLAGQLIEIPPVAVLTETFIQEQLKRITDSVQAHAKTIVEGEINDEQTRQHLVGRVDTFVKNVLHARENRIEVFAISDETNNSPEDIENHMLNVDVWAFETPVVREPESYKARQFIQDHQAGTLPSWMTTEDGYVMSHQFTSAFAARDGVAVMIVETETGYNTIVHANAGIKEWAKRFPNNIGAPEYWRFISGMDVSLAPAFKAEAAKHCAKTIDTLTRTFNGRFKREPEVSVFDHELYIQIDLH